jgi:signal recognition particle subunit SEC65
MATDLHTAANRLLKAWDLNDLIYEHIEALRQALANEALDKMAENARELGLDYEPARDSGIVTAGGADPRTQRTWVGLTDEDDIDWEEGGNLRDLVKAIEAKLKEKNT